MSATIPVMTATSGQTSQPLLLELPPRWRLAADVGLAALVWAACTVSVASLNPRPPWEAYLVIALAALPLAARGRRPTVAVGCAVAATALSGAVPLLPEGATWPPLAIALISFAARNSIRRALAAAAGAMGAHLIALGADGAAVTLAPVGTRLVAVAALTALGLYLGTRRAYVEQLRARGRDLERERELLSERAVGEERVRIARELHDAVAHHVSLLVVQAGAIRESLPEGARARGMADSMAATGRQALEEMRSMLGLLRTGAQPLEVELAPQPGVGDLETLVEQIRRAGVEAELTIEGERRELPVGVELSAYRIAQESLTNVVKHAGTTRARVLLRYRPDRLELRVTDDGAGRVNGHATAGGGHGLVGMRERVALYGGELSAGPGPGGGWAVRAVLPLEPLR